MALTAVTNEEVSGKQARELYDDEVLAVLGREAKKRREAAEAFTAPAGPSSPSARWPRAPCSRPTCPTQLTDDEVAALVAAAVAEATTGGAEGPRAMGAVMKLVQPQVDRPRRRWPGGRRGAPPARRC